MAKVEREFTPDKRAGLEKASSALARVLDFTLQRETNQERQRQALEAVAQEQQFRKQLKQQEMNAALSRMQSDLAFRNVANERTNKLKRAELDELIRHHKAMEGTNAEKARSLALLRSAQSKKYDKQGTVESLSKSIDERIKQLRALSDFTIAGTPAAQMRTQMILKELRPLQNALDIARSGGEIPENFTEQLEGAERSGFREYLRGTGLPIPPESVFEQAPNVNALNNIATQGNQTPQGNKTLEEMTIDELINQMGQ
jgi:hypothetical protein